LFRLAQSVGQGCQGAQGFDQIKFFGWWNRRRHGCRGVAIGEIEIAGDGIDDFGGDRPFLIDKGTDQAMLTEQIDDARNAQRVTENGDGGFGIENRFAIRARDAKALGDIGLGFLEIKRMSFGAQRQALAQLPASPLRWLGILAILVCLPAKLHLNPFSLPNAEQEIYSGPMTEYAGPELAMWELSHGLEWVAATGLAATLIAPALTLWWVAALVFVALTFAIVLLLSVVAAATARLQIDTTVRFYWQCTLIFAVLAVASALFMRFRA